MVYYPPFQYGSYATFTIQVKGLDNKKANELGMLTKVRIRVAVPSSLQQSLNYTSPPLFYSQEAFSVLFSSDI
jgi:hypothetical protein